MRNKDTALVWLLSAFFGVLASAFLIFGYQLENFDSINLSDRNAMLVMLAMMVILTIDTRYVFRSYDYALSGKKLFGLIALPQRDEKRSVSRMDFTITWIILILLCIPVLMAEYPGFFVYDAQDELNEVLTRSFTTHHPLLHVLLMGGTIALIHKLTGSWNLGIFSYIFLQMLVITAIFAYVLTYMKKHGIGQKSRILWTLYYGIFPPIVMFALCSSKDGLFSALLLLLTLFLVMLTRDYKGFISDRRKVIAFVTAALLMPCFRHNGFYAYLVFIPFALIYFRKKIKKIFLAMLFLPVILYLTFSVAVSSILGAGETHHQEMLTVPIMQLARVYKYDRDSLSDDDISTITSYIPEENLKLYTPRVADLVKIGFDNERYEKDSGAFWKVWSKLLIKHPATYLNAWLLTSYGYWYPPAILNVYKGTTVYTFTYENSSYFGYEVEQPGQRSSFFPPIDSLYRYLSIGDFQTDAPVLALFFKPGFYLFIYMFVFAYRLSKKQTDRVLPFIPMILTFLTVLLGPTYLVRYVLVLWLCFPLLFD